VTLALIVWLAPLALAVPSLGPTVLEHAEGAGSAAGAEVQRQVRVDQRMVIRIAPHSATRRMLATGIELPRPRYRERKIGKCLPLAAIAGVRIGGDDRLLLSLHDRRLIGASLEKSCHARDFYSGFYVERSRDGRLCVDRDMLLSRSGASCSLSRLRQLDARERRSDR
jgi:hypothetical protein